MDKATGNFIQFMVNLWLDKLGKFSGHPSVFVHADGADFYDFKLQLFVRRFRLTALVPFQIQYYEILFRHVCLLVLTSVLLLLRSVQFHDFLLGSRFFLSRFQIKRINLVIA